VRKLLAELSGIPAERRWARFRSVVALACPDGSRRSFEGTLEGSIAAEARGSGGFGYDPVFLLPGGATLAELRLAEKNRLSHRGAAFAAFARWLVGRGGRICPCDPGVEY
jgi:XTP/dITP diphosphohydrolase